ncbi:hypothetical protein NDN08_004347 [Rhodosorus marinus]|uniref:Integrase catalytic domain-containing protein n=1 Tax=Rhodosorus marinus TaxID=101924 RepID=A0AAV8UPY4_9RHOD|nr:hypothetical protein NDN08_004347 [Rhodosorus marinus]
MMDLLTRFVVAVPIKEETKEVIAKIILERWFLLFGPPEGFLSGRGTSFLSNVLQDICRKMGIRRILTSAFHPQTNGAVEKFNIALASYRYNSAVHSATKCSPFRAMFGVQAFDFGVDYNLRFRQESDPTREDLAEHVKELHEERTKHSWKAKETEKKCYDKAVSEVEFKPGDRVNVFYPPDVLGVGRKLSTPWLGPYRVQRRLGNVRYLLEGEQDPAKIARVHVNRLRAWDERFEETGDPRDGVFPDSRRLLRLSRGI